jgi:Flp pilus assembly protein TadB
MALALLVAAAACAEEARRAWGRDRAINGRNRRSGSDRLRKLAALGRRTGRLAGWMPEPPFERERLCERAGCPQDIGVATLREARAGSTVLLAMIGASGLVLADSVVGLVAFVACAGFGWLYPDLWMRSAAGRRSQQIESQAPLALDLIAATVSAGVGLDHALAAAAEASSGPLRAELERVASNLALGRRRGEELRDLADRTGSPSLIRLAAALRVSDRLGVPLADGLRRQARRARADRALRVQERAATAAPRMLLVVVLMLVPAALLPVVAALALTALGSAGQLGL